MSARATLALATLLALVAAPLPHAAAADPPGPEDLEPIRKLLVDTVMPPIRSTYNGTVCPNVGGFYTFQPPGLAQTTGAGCRNPWCHGPVSLWCLNQDKLTQPDKALCVAHQTVTPAEIPIPGQDAVSPLYVRCLNPLYQVSAVGGVCDEPVQVLCFYGSELHPCYAYASTVGCVGLQSGPCREAVQLMCWGFVHVNGQPRYQGFCVVWIDAVKQCITTTS